MGNIGVQKVSYKYCLLGACCSLVLLLGYEHIAIETMTLFSTIAACYNVEWDIDKEPPQGVCNLLKRAFVLSVIGCLYMCLWGSVIYYNVHITTSDGVQVPIHEAMENFFKSPAWKEFKTSLGKIYNTCQRMGWDECYFKLMEHLDPAGEANAYRVMN